MKKTLYKIKKNMKISYVIKVALCVFILLTIIRLQFFEGIEAFKNYKDYSVRNDNLGGESFDLASSHSIDQEFVATGNVLNNIQIYYGNAPTGVDVRISVKDGNGKSIVEENVNTSAFNQNSWNDVGLSGKVFNRNESYRLCIASEGGLEGFMYGNGVAPDSFTNISSEGSKREGHLLMGISMTYSYFNLAGFFELIVTTFFLIVIGIALCITVLNFEEFYGTFQNAPKQGFSYALFFSISIILLYNPIDDIRTRVTAFKRVIGGGLNYDVDVSKRINNFNYWFIAFGLVFVLLFMFANYYLRKEKTEDQKKIIGFLDNFIIIANCSLLLRCITFFKDASDTSTSYYFSQNIIMLLALTAICYVFFAIDSFIPLERFEQLVTAVISVSIMLSVFWGRELENGKLILGIATFLITILLVSSKYLGKICEKKQVAQALPFVTVVLSFIPLATSLYIELIHVLNQYELFVAHPAKYYKIACIIGFIVSALLLYLIAKKTYRINNWKQVVFPTIVVGVTCLSIQIPISSIYNPDLFEGANASILISDFLNYGDIPIVQHYGGHMMTGVWEGILYAVINNDFAGIVSPYSGLLNVVLALLFYLVITKIWNSEMGLVTTLLFPFLNFFSYYGLGILVCLAAMAYVRKNTMKRAILLWGSFAWCALYRLDLGFAFGVAVIVALIVYVVAEKNKKALKELCLSLMGLCIVGGIGWLGLCIIKGINPFNRVIEFLMINLSNQNWAYTGIGTVDNMVFAWGYIIVPFVMVLTLLYVVLSKGFRKKIGTEKWMLLLILNLSYFQNFSRGLVRHSLAENVTHVVFWCAYLFFAMFLAFYKDNMKWFVPTFMVLILLNGLFLKPDNFTSLTIADSAVSAPESIIESWKPTRFYEEEDIKADDGTVFNTKWEKIKYMQEKVERVELDDELVNYASEYEVLLNELLEDDETFVDFVNKTILYSVLGYRCPVYVSQSPLQLSGEFTQKEFIKEIEGVPVVLMPIDGENYRASSSLDGVANTYRYYLVYEYIYRNYKPLCKYDDEYAVWCLPEKYEQYKNKIESLVGCKEYVQDILASESILKKNVEIETTDDSSITLRCSGTDPMLTELQNLIDVSAYDGHMMKISIDYKTDMPGTMQLYYTTNENENYVAGKAIDVQISEEGTATFMVPITSYSRLRLDIPEGSTVIIKSFKCGSFVEYIDYGYDGPVENVDEAGNTTYSYINVLHNSSIAKLPRIWAETDEKGSVNNQMVCILTNTDGYYTFDNNSVPESDDGNYLKITADYDGLDTEGKYSDDDESVGATIVFGYYKNDKYVEKYCYGITFDEGNHDYLIRCSADYYWYLQEVNAVRIETTGNLRNVSMSVLEGD